MYSKKAYAKVNIFLKIAGKRNDYHELVSRFCRVQNLYDIVHFVPNDLGAFSLKGDFGCAMKNNTIYKVYSLLCTKFPKVKEFFQTHGVEVEKNIPEFAGLGGGSSDAATFMLMCNEVLDLRLNKDELNLIGQQVGADIPFFIYEYDSANVTGIGEIVEKFDEPILDIEVITPAVKCDTGAIFRTYAKYGHNVLSKDEAETLLAMNSMEIFETYSIEYANDLYQSAVKCNKSLQKVTSTQNGKKYFFSGSGSSFFTLNSIGQ